LQSFVQLSPATRSTSALTTTGQQTGSVSPIASDLAISRQQSEMQRRVDFRIVDDAGANVGWLKARCVPSG